MTWPRSHSSPLGSKLTLSHGKEIKYNNYRFNEIVYFFSSEKIVKSEDFSELLRKDCNISFYSSYFCSKHYFLNILASLFFLHSPPNHPAMCLPDTMWLTSMTA